MAGQLAEKLPSFRIRAGCNVDGGSVGSSRSCEDKKETGRAMVRYQKQERATEIHET